ncbi:hypothetical protein AMECASPLE_006356 [Ameca splendens]|uniref:Uncharacterized protein n=1 Tax=Ameca splendens TaxID=208324 RepID=A0ABV0YYT4_9TELE
MYGGRCSGQMRLNFNFSTIKEMLCLVQTQYIPSPQENQPHCETWWWHHHDVGRFFSSRDWETGLSKGKERMDGAKYRDILEESLPVIWNEDGGSPSRRTMIQSNDFCRLCAVASHQLKYC